MRQSQSHSEYVIWSLDVTIISFLFSFFHPLVSRELISEICNMSVYIWAPRKCYDKSNKVFKPLLSQLYTGDGHAVQDVYSKKFCSIRLVLSLGGAQRSMRWRPWSRNLSPSLWQQYIDPPLAKPGDGKAHPFLQGSTVLPSNNAGPPLAPHLLHCPAHTKPWCPLPIENHSTLPPRGTPTFRLDCLRSLVSRQMKEINEF